MRFDFIYFKIPSSVPKCMPMRQPLVCRALIKEEGFPLDFVNAMHSYVIFSPGFPVCSVYAGGAPSFLVPLLDCLYLLEKGDKNKISQKEKLKEGICIFFFLLPLPSCLDLKFELRWLQTGIHLRTLSVLAKKRKRWS